MHPVRLADYATKLSGSIGDCLQQLLGKKRNTLLSGRGGGSPCKQAYGFPTWALSSINVFLDLISLPYINRGVYRLGDLPTAQREEVMRLIQAAKDVDLVGQLDERAKENERTMIFFQWYGVNVHTFLDVPAFHQPWKYIETIGVSIFNRRVSTSKH